MTLVAILVLALALLSAPAFLWGGREEVVRLAAAAGVCVPLSLASYQASKWSLPRGPLWQMGVLLGGSLVRMFLALALALLLYFTVPALKSSSFLIWVAMTYVLALAVEASLLVRELHRWGQGESPQS